MGCFERLYGLLELTQTKDSACFTSESKNVLFIWFWLNILLGFVIILLVEILIETEVSIAKTLHQTLHMLGLDTKFTHTTLEVRLLMIFCGWGKQKAVVACFVFLTAWGRSLFNFYHRFTSGISCMSIERLVKSSKLKHFISCRIKLFHTWVVVTASVHWSIIWNCAI